MRFNKRFADRQTQTESAKLRSPRLLERVKNSRHHLGIDPAAGIFDLNAKSTVIAIRSPNGKLAAVGCKLDRVLDQVPKNLLQTRGIGLQKNFFGREVGSELEFLLIDIGMANFERVAQQSVRVDHFETELHFAFADSGQVEKIVDQACFELDVAPDELEGFVHCLRQIFFALEREDRREHGRERRAQLVTQHCQKTILRFAGALGFDASVLGDRLLAKHPFALYDLTLDLVRLAEKIDKHCDLRAQNIGNDRRENVIHRAERITARDVIHRVVDRADENDRCSFATLPLSNQSGGFKAVHAGHVYVEEDGGEIFFEETSQRFFAGPHANQVLIQRRQHHFVSEQLVRPIVDDKNADFVFRQIFGAVCLH